MTQAFNAFGTTVAPFFGSYLIYGATGEHGGGTPGASDVQVPYLILAASLLLLALIFMYLKLPKLNHTSASTGVFKGGAWHHKHLVLGAVGIFMYVGAEVAIGSMLVNYLASPAVGGLSEAGAAKLLAYYWGGAMVGRFIGAVVMQKISGGYVLAFNACMAIALILLSLSSTGDIALWSILGVGLFNSIMFPTIFSLALHQLHPTRFRHSLFSHSWRCHYSTASRHACRHRRRYAVIFTTRFLLPLHCLLWACRKSCISH
jgi:FHS family L-fucose permease-like MFS transporter